MLYQALTTLSFAGAAALSASAVPCHHVASSVKPAAGLYSVQMSAAEEMGIPCIGECALNAYPKLPESVHPGVVTGQALVDLLADAKEKGVPEALLLRKLPA